MNTDGSFNFISRQKAQIQNINCYIKSVTIVWDGGGERSQKWNSDVLVFGRMELYLELNCIFYSNIMYTKNYIRQLLGIYFRQIS